MSTTNSLRLGLLSDPDFIADLESSIPERQVAEKWGCSKTAVNKWRSRIRADGYFPTARPKTKPADIKGQVESFDQDPHGNVVITKNAERIIPLDEWLNDLRDRGFDPEDFTYSIGHSVWMQHTRNQETKTLYANRFSATRKAKKESAASGPAWQPVDRGPLLSVKAPSRGATSLAGQWKTAILAADSQIGYRLLDSGQLDPFHDQAALDVMLQLVDIERPDQFVFMGDILDLTEQGRWVQEASFARTTQPAIDYLTRLGAELRARVPGKIVYLEGNHDKRMQNFVETNALSAFGLRKGDLPESWPVMSLPNLLRLDEFDIQYMDGYPAAHWWVNDQLRCEHGTKVRSSGSTAEKYANETPHISRAFGHTHRLEAQSKTTWDRAGKIKSVALNPGCLCRVDGAVPGVNSAVGSSGRPLVEYENWQQGVAVIRYKESGEFFWNLVQIEGGQTVYEGAELAAA